MNREEAAAIAERLVPCKCPFNEGWGTAAHHPCCPRRSIDPEIVANALEDAYRKGRNYERELCQWAEDHRGVIDCTSGDLVARFMCPRADGIPSTLPVTVDGSVIGFHAKVWTNEASGGPLEVTADYILWADDGTAIGSPTKAYSTKADAEVAQEKDNDSPN